MKHWLCFAAIVAVTLAGCSDQFRLPPAPPPATILTHAREAGELTADALVAKLQHGGTVIYFRHAATDRSTAEGTTTTLQDCSTQRNLNDKGIVQAQVIGQAFNRLNIPVGSILSSGYCRARDTAKIAFGRVDAVVPDLTGFIVEERERRVATLRQLLATVPLSNTNTVIVAHGANIANAAQVSLIEGEAAIFQPDGKNFKLLGQVRPDQWRELTVMTATTVIRYEPTDEALLNPERGFHDDIELVNETDLNWVRASRSSRVCRGLERSKHDLPTPPQKTADVWLAHALADVSARQHQDNGASAFRQCL